MKQVFAALGGKFMEICLGLAPGRDKAMTELLNCKCHLNCLRCCTKVKESKKSKQGKESEEKSRGFFFRKTDRPLFWSGGGRKGKGVGLLLACPSSPVVSDRITDSR